MPITYHKLPDEVARNMSLPAKAAKLYMYLLSMSNINTGETPPIYIIHLAERFQRKGRTIQKWLKELIDGGFIIRVSHKDKDNPKHNHASHFIIVHAKAHLQDNKRPAAQDAKKFTSGESGVHGKRDFRVRNSESLESNENLTLTGGDPEDPRSSESFEQVSQRLLAELDNTDESAEAPKATPIDKTVNHDTTTAGGQPKAPVSATTQGTYDSSEVPEGMRSSVEYLLSKTGRPTLRDQEYDVIRELDGKYTPEQIKAQVDKQIELKKRNNGNIRQVTFYLIGNILLSRKAQPKPKYPRVASVAAPTTVRAVQQVREVLPEVSVQILPVDEAERIISEYTPAKPVEVKNDAGISPERQELLERIKRHQDELTQELFRRHPQLCDPDPHAEFVEFGEDELLDLEFTVEDYLRLKFPEATEEELQRRDYCHDRDLKKAFDYDYACAICENPETCPFNRKNGRAVVLLKEIAGRKGLSTAWASSIGCKYPDADKKTDKPNPELEQRVKSSGLTEWQSKQTFESYEHAGAKPEIVSAKAKAILAAKNNTSLVLAGKAGTGKTHLAIAIAMEAMKSGRNALFRTVPDLLDELARADWEHDDFFGLRQKFRDVSCLVLDDLGKEKSTPKKLEYLYQIIDYRYSHGLQTIVTTNAYDMNGLVNDDNAKVIEPLVSRLLEKGEWVMIREAENHRL